MATPVRLRIGAAQDIDEAIAYYQREAGDAVAGRFIHALERTLNRISRTPHAGALRFAYDLDIPGLRHLGLARFPCAVFYVATADEIDVWRVLHVRRDLAVAVTDPR
jgi:toxin ParE1/3/4